MNLAIDIGNTTLSMAVLEGKKIIEKVSLPQPISSKDLERRLIPVNRKFKKIEKVIICSVVPQSCKICKRAIKRIFKIDSFVVGEDIKVPIKNEYKKPKQVGQDRLVCSYAAKCLYGEPLIIVDLGTAITLDVVSKKGEYLGGMIIPGIKLSTESLCAKTALLPKVNVIKRPSSLIGKDTEGSILSGIFFGYGVMICGLVNLLAKKIKSKPKVIITGGYADIMKRYIGCKIDKIEKDLVFEGLLLLLNKKTF